MSTNLYVPSRPLSRDKLGLSLAGGGFRASLFHLGVLRRLAEMDVLRRVEVLSTVSGGSIIGAHYILLLKAALDHNPTLSREEYVELVQRLEKEFIEGVQLNLRTRLLMNPFGILRTLLTSDTLSRRMGRIYERYLYRGVVEELETQDQRRKETILPERHWLVRRIWPGRIPLAKVRFNQRTERGLEAYNQQAHAEGRSAIPNFIMNATALNSGAPFRLSSNEIGDPRLGYFRYDELDILEAHKTLLESSPADLKAMRDAKKELPKVKVGPPLQPRDAALAQWWRTRNTTQPISPLASNHWTLLFKDPKQPDPDLEHVINAMCQTNFGRLRQLKLPAWYVKVGTPKNITGGLSEAGHLLHFNQVLAEVEPQVLDKFTKAVAEQDPLGQELLDFALALYYLRSAEVMSPRLRRDFDGISLGTAVAASANFPPVFPPLVLLGIYDDLYVTRLGLSDGGVYDNMGITTLIDEGCTHIIASDTGAPFDVKQRVTSRYLGMIGRLPSVLTDDVADQQRTILRTRRHVSASLAHCGGRSPQISALKEEFGLRGLAFFSIESLNPPGVPGIKTWCDPTSVASLRTDLDAFGDMEVAALMNTGYDHAERYLQVYLRDSSYWTKSWDSRAEPPRLPVDLLAYGRKIARVLEVGQSRLFRLFGLFAPYSWFILIAILVTLGYFLGNREVKVVNLLASVFNAILARLRNPYPLFDRVADRFTALSFLSWVNRKAAQLIDEPIRLRTLVLVPVGVYILVFKAWPKAVRWFETTKSPILRGVVTGTKLARAVAPALFLLAGLTPIWIAAIVSIIGWVSYLLFSKPFLWATKVRFAAQPMIQSDISAGTDSDLPGDTTTPAHDAPEAPDQGPPG
jgi:predicted acylesterase/phospholipase RssA